jgi:SAM-dependent methyltransferase
MSKLEAEDKEFAAYWDARTGDKGDPYRKHVLNPAMFKAIDSFADKIVLDVGCGNGYLAKQFLQAGAKKVICFDKSVHSVEYAASNNKKYPQVECFVQDVEQPWKLDDQSVDIIFSNMVLHMVENLKLAQSEAYRVLDKQSGTYVFSITPPSHALCAKVEEQLGKPSRYLGLGGYFEQRMCSYMMLSENAGLPDCKIPYYHRTLEDYFNTTLEAGFAIDALYEPQVNDALLAEAPRFVEYKDRPASMIFRAQPSILSNSGL